MGFGLQLSVFDLFCVLGYADSMHLKFRVSAYSQDQLKPNKYGNIYYYFIVSIFFFQVPIVALTATATPVVRKDICQSLKLRNASFVCTGFDR